MTALATAIGRGTLAARPAAGSPGRVYYVTDGTPTLYRDNGSSWDSIGETGAALTVQDEGTPLATAADTLNFTGAGVTASGTTGTKTINIPGGSGGWTEVVNLDGTSVAGGTALSGTWASSAGVIQQTLSGASVRRWRYDTRVNTAHMVAQVDVRFPTGGATTRSAGILLGWPGTDVANYMLMQLLRDTTSKFQLSQDALANPLDETVTVNLDTWYTIRAVVAGYRVAGYLDGVLKGTLHFGGGASSITANHLAHFVGLRAFDATVEFDNFKVWIPTLPA